MTNQKTFSEKYFTTYDMGVTAALIASGYILDHLDKTNPRKAQFVFQRVYGIEKIVENFWAMKLHVDAQTYFNAIKLIKNRLYSD